LIFLGLLVHSRIDISGRPTVAEVSLSALRHNCRRARELSGPDVAVMAVVKADAYGHGAVPAARAFLDAGAQALGVSSVAEAVELRRAGLAGALLVLGGAFPGEEETVVAQDLAVALWDADQARALAGAARTAGRQVAVHLKVDTGMTRLGLDLADVSSFAALVRGLGTLRVAGVFSHFASADAVETAAARAQTGRFVGAVEALVAAGLRPPEVHLANSAAVLAAPEARFTMVRPGIMLYGYSPAPHLAARAAVRPAMRLRTRVARAHDTTVRDAPGNRRSGGHCCREAERGAARLPGQARRRRLPRSQERWRPRGGCTVIALRSFALVTLPPPAGEAERDRGPEQTVPGDARNERCWTASETEHK